jgi:hypothetical protein
MATCKQVSTPLPVNLELSLKDSPEVVDPELKAEYRAVVSSLMYLYQCTRPDLGGGGILGVVATFLSRYVHKPGIKHLQTTKLTLRCLSLQGTKTMIIRYTGS